MKKLTPAIPWILVAIFGAWILSALRPRPEAGFHLAEFGRLPVVLNGRVQPLDSVARNSLLQTRSKQSVRLDNSRSLPAIDWLAETLMQPQVADTRKIFRVDHPELLGLLKLPPEEKDFSFNQLKGSLPELERQAERIREIDEKTRTPFEKQVMRLADSLTLYTRLKNSLQPEGTSDFAADVQQFRQVILPGVAAVQSQRTGKDFNQRAFDKILEHLGRYQVMARMAGPLLVPPAAGQPRDAWANIGASLMSTNTLQTGRLDPAVTYYAAMSSAFAQNNPEEFNRAVAGYRQWLGQQQLLPELRQGQREFFYNQFEAFYKALVIYVMAFLLVCVSWFNRSDTLRRSGYYLTALAFMVHTFGLGFRMMLEGRPPVTNLYSSAIFVGWGAVVLGLVLERFYRDGIGTVVASLVGFLTLIIAHNLALGGETMEPLRAVLDTNFWLATHVVTITIGYASTFVAGFLAILYIVRGVFTPSLSATTARSLQRMVYGIVCFATLFSFIGTILGGIWADQSWGRFWGWDPKENGALLIVLWNAAYLHVRWGGLLKERGLMNMAVFGNVVTAFSWFGVNMLGVGLHSYGFMDQAFKWLMVFNASQIAIILLGMLPQEYWRSFRHLPPPLPGPAALAEESASEKSGT